MGIRHCHALPGLLLLLTVVDCGSGGSSSGGATDQPVAALAGPPALALDLQAVAAGLSSPVYLTAPTGDPRLFILERTGRILVVQNGVVLPAPFLDIRDRISMAGEGGLLSMAFDPQYAGNGLFYVYFTDLTGGIAVERYRVSPDPNVADPMSQLRILSIPHPTFSNHYGGLLVFGPDNFLYMGTGDGGSAGDPNKNAQNTASLLGKLLRIDVSNASPQTPYAIPPANPFAAQPSSRGEIWAYGLRNPWRYAFDAGLLYIADVGQAQREEIDVAPDTAGGLNYGWNLFEGTPCFSSGACNPQGLTPPVLEYDHAGGGCAIIGGYVYRGTAIPELQGSYLYTDLCTGRLQSFVYANGAATQLQDFGSMNVGSIQSFGRDAQNELYLLSDNGTAYRIVRKAEPPPAPAAPPAGASAPSLQDSAG